MGLVLSCFDFTLSYRPGSKNTKLVALSRQFSQQEKEGGVCWGIELSSRFNVKGLILEQALHVSCSYPAGYGPRFSRGASCPTLLLIQENLCIPSQMVQVVEKEGKSLCDGLSSVHPELEPLLASSRLALPSTHPEKSLAPCVCSLSSQASVHA